MWRCLQCGIVHLNHTFKKSLFSTPKCLSCRGKLQEVTEQGPPPFGLIAYPCACTQKYFFQGIPAGTKQAIHHCDKCGHDNLLPVQYLKPTMAT